MKYDQFSWQVIGDFKMVAFLMGLQGGFTKFPRYLCYWDSRNINAHYHRRIWPKRTEFFAEKTMSTGPLNSPQQNIDASIVHKIRSYQTIC